MARLRHLLLAGALGLAAWTAAAADPRYGTFGRLPGQSLPWRDGWCGAALVDQGADFVTVGALDVTTGGPYAHLQADFLQINLRWLPLVDWHDQVPPRRWYSLYHRLLDRLGVPAGLRSKQDVLAAQLAAEAPELEALLQAYGRSSREAYRFEIANEPNAYPYMSPELYAWYYGEWRRCILAAAARHGTAGKVRLMPGGLWVWEVSAAPGVAVLRRFAAPEAVSTELYYRRFLRALGERTAPEGAALGEAELQRRGGALVDLGNLHFYPWVYADAASATGEPVATHLRRHCRRLGALSQWVAAHATSRQVWLTEAGNINPLSDDELARDFMTPFLDGLDRLGAPGNPAGITRWHWFKAAGEDSKFKAFQEVRPYLPVLRALVWPAALVLGLDPRDLRCSLGIVECWARQNPSQGLRSRDGQPRKIEPFYLERSRRPPPPGRG
ncbi:MAG: hypothetical protein WC708_07655 [Lentisphaeria bacterium]